MGVPLQESDGCVVQIEGVHAAQTAATVLCTRLLGVGLELGAQLALLELLGEALVIAPEQADV